MALKVSVVRTSSKYFVGPYADISGRAQDLVIRSPAGSGSASRTPRSAGLGHVHMSRKTRSRTNKSAESDSTAAPSGKWPQLPAELWQMVILEIIGNDVALTRYTTRATLCALALTCQYLHQVVSPSLFDFVYFGRTASFNRYVDTLRRLKKMPPISFTLNIPEANSYASEANPDSSFRQFIDLVFENPRLRTLNVRGVLLPPELDKLRVFSVEQVVRVTQASPYYYGFRDIPLNWWTDSLKRVCLGPEQYFDARLWGLFFSHGGFDQVILQYTSLLSFTQSHILDVGADDCYESVTSARDARLNRKIPHMILIQRLDGPRREYPIDRQALRVLRAAAVTLVPYLCLGLEIYDQERKPVMSIANEWTWSVLRDKAVQL